ncbi:hypothetical protein CVT24_012673 [Panaeolus cyanescens]|uniref:Uncharacterized protein n=1 Tax=Panaeolus cyanescens TaxID=181874 RepID=A0A409YKC0_9AGAR|nr:hypothetical protein CVT24_012673 [Panaeolus cyanescens]
MGISNVYRWVSRRLKHQASTEIPESSEEPRHHLFSLRNLKRVFRRGFTRNGGGHNPSHDYDPNNETSSNTPTHNHDQNHNLVYTLAPLPAFSPLIGPILPTNEEYNDSFDKSIAPQHSPSLTLNDSTSPEIILSPSSLPISDASLGHDPYHEHPMTTSEPTDAINNDYDQNNDLHLRTPLPHDNDLSSPQAHVEDNNSDVPVATQILLSPASDDATLVHSPNSIPFPSSSPVMQSNLTISDLPPEILQLIFRFYLSNKAAFDFSMQMQYNICSVSPHWRDVAVSDTHHFWDLAVYDWNRAAPLQKWLFQVSNPQRPPSDASKPATMPPAKAKTNRVSLDLPASARQTQLNELRQFISNHLHHCDHVQIHIPLYDGHPPSHLAEPTNPDDDYVLYARAMFPNATLFNILEYLNLSRSLHSFSWSSLNPLVNSLSSFLHLEGTHATGQPQIGHNSQPHPSTSSENSGRPLSPAKRWPALSHLRINSRIRFHKCVSIFKEFLSLKSATLGPISLASHTAAHLIYSEPFLGALQSLTLTFLTMFDVQVALHGLFGATGCLLKQPLESLTIICQNRRFSTASGISNTHDQNSITNSELSFHLHHQLNSLELVDVSFKDGIELLQRWKPATLSGLIWNNITQDVPQQSMLMGISDVADVDPVLPVFWDIEALSISFPPMDEIKDEERSWIRTSALLSQIRPSQPATSVTPAGVSLVLSHHPKSFHCLFRLPLVALTITSRISTADCLNILSGCAGLRYLDVAINRSGVLNKQKRVDIGTLRKLRLAVHGPGLATSLFSHIKTQKFQQQILCVEMSWHSSIGHPERSNIEITLKDMCFKVRSESIYCKQIQSAEVS